MLLNRSQVNHHGRHYAGGAGFVPHAILFYRQMLHRGFGGMGIIVLAVAILYPRRRGCSSIGRKCRGPLKDGAKCARVLPRRGETLAWLSVNAC